MNHGELIPTSLASDAALDRRITRNIVGSFLISVVTLPFGYLIALILARVSSEAVGSYGVLGIYLGVVSSILYFGGGTVSVHFMAELPREKRLPFFFSYFVLTLGAVALVVVLFLLLPWLAKLIFGRDTDMRLWLLLLLCAPVPLFCYAALATLRGLLDVTYAQTLLRSLTLGASFAYGYVLLFHREFFQEQYATVVFVPYFFLLFVVGVLALGRIVREVGRPGLRWGWFLPSGFWSFSLSVQVASMLALMHRKIDQIVLVLGLGLSELGIYWVIVQLADTPGLLHAFFLEGVFPGIVNLRARKRFDKVVELYQKAGRLLLLISATITCFLFAFSGPVLAFFGDQYVRAYPAFLLFLFFTTLDSLGPLNHTLIVGLKRMNYWTVTQGIRLAGFLILFPMLIDRFGLLGVVLARGFAWFLAGAFAYGIVLFKLPVRPRIPGQYFLLVALGGVLGTLCYLRPGVVSAWGWNVTLFFGSLATFLVLGGYRLSELQQFRSFWRDEDSAGVR